VVKTSRGFVSSFSANLVLLSKIFAKGTCLAISSPPDDDLKYSCGPARYIGDDGGVEV
jgi:hypothetical protein